MSFLFNNIILLHMGLNMIIPSKYTLSLFSFVPLLQANIKGIFKHLPSFKNLSCMAQLAIRIWSDGCKNEPVKKIYDSRLPFSASKKWKPSDITSIDYCARIVVVYHHISKFIDIMIVNAWVSLFLYSCFLSIWTW